MFLILDGYIYNRKYVKILDEIPILRIIVSIITVIIGKVTTLLVKE